GGECLSERARSDIPTSCPDFCGFVSPEHWRNVGSFLRRAALHVSAQFWQPDSKSFCRFRATAVPRDRQTGSRGISRSAHSYKLHFVSFVVRSATLKKPRNGGNFRDRMWECRTAHARSDIPHLVRASPRHPANASRHAKKFRVPLTVLELVKQKIAGPRASGVGSDFVIDDGTGKTLGMVVGVTE
ncbi:hypothetical protein ACSLO2_26255, partial [Escherichia coli]